MSPYPDLVVTEIKIPRILHTGDILNINATITNNGIGSPFEHLWSDGLVITESKNGFRYYSSIHRTFIGTGLLHGLSYQSIFSFKLPPSLPNGDYTAIVTTDVNDEVFEFQSEDNNNKIMVFTVVQQLADLTVGPSSAFVQVNATGNYLGLNISIINIGVGTVQEHSWEDTIILSSTSSDDEDFVLATITSYNIAFQGNSVNMPFQLVYIPVRLFGEIHVYVSLDTKHRVLETDESNNKIRIGTVLLEKRETDLAVTNANVPESAYAGSLVIVQWEVENIGNIASGSWLSWNDEIAISFGNATVAILGRLLVKFDNFLHPGQKYMRLLNVTIPSHFVGPCKIKITTGNYQSGGEGKESNILNNEIEVPVTIKTSPQPEVELKSHSYDLNTLTNCRYLTISCEITNIGNSMHTTAHWMDQISLLNSNGSVVLLSQVSSTKKLLSLETYTVLATLVLPPTSEGYYQCQLDIDISNSVMQSSSNKRFILPTPVFIPKRKFAILSVTIQPLQESIIFGGDIISVKCTITNTGQAHLPQSTWTDGLYLYFEANSTKERVISSGTLVSSVVQTTQLSIDDHYEVTFTGRVPHFYTDGAYVYIISDINNRLPDYRVGAVSSHSRDKIQIHRRTLPDLTVSFDNHETIEIQSGQTFDLSFSVSNIGNSTADGVWYDTVYLSQDWFLDSFDVALKTLVRLRTLESKDTYSQTATIVFPYDLTGTTYYIVLATNVRRDCIESSYENNHISKHVNLQVLPAVDLVVINVTSSKLNVTYSDQLTFTWLLVNNGSIGSKGRTCESIYLSSDCIWDITDTAVVDSRCGLFSLAPRGNVTYSSTAKIPPLPSGQYKPVVRTRSNVRDFNLTNNIGFGNLNLSVNPPTISLNEMKTISMRTNQYLVYQLTGIPAGITVVVSLTTQYQFAHHRLYVKQHSLPSTNDYDATSKVSATTQQRVSLSNTKSGVYYLLIESANTNHNVSYGLTITVKEAKFEATSVFPTTLLSEANVTLKIDGNLFVKNMRVFLKNSTSWIAATAVYRYIPDEIYATFNTESLKGNYTMTFHDDDNERSFEFTNPIVVTDSVLPGKLLLDMVLPSAVRAGSSAVIQVRIANTGNSDINCPLVLLRTGEHSTVVSTETDNDTPLSGNVAFFPLKKNRPHSMLPPGSSLTFSFKISPLDVRYVGTEEIQLGTINNDQLLKIIQDTKDSVDTHSQNSEVREMHWRNIERCFGNDPSKLANRISGHFIQHYTSLFTLKDIVSHVFKIADGGIPQNNSCQFFRY